MTAEILVFPPADSGEALANLEAETGLLGALLVNNSTFGRVAELVTDADFSHPTHGEIFALIATVLSRGEQADVIRLRSHVSPERGAYLLRLVSSVVTIVNAPDYALTIRDLAMRRRLRDTGLAIGEAAQITEIDADPFAMLDRAQAMLLDIGSGSVRAQGPRSSAEIMAATMQRIELAHKGATAGMATGLVDLDRLLGGIEPGTLTILAGRPGMGKTALGLAIANNAASAGISVGFFSLEMSGEQLGMRVISSHMGISLQDLRTGRLPTDHVADISRRVRDLSRMALHIDDSPAPTVARMLTRARQLKSRYGLGFVVIDYLQLIQAGGNDRANRTEQVTQISAALKGMAKALDVPVMALSQLSRALEGRDDKRPQLSDLRDSGAIEQDADAVLFVYRDGYYLDRDEPRQGQNESAEKYGDRRSNWEDARMRANGVCEIIVGKQRQGPTGTVRVYFNPITGKFADLHEGSTTESAL